MKPASGSFGGLSVVKLSARDREDAKRLLTLLTTDNLSIESGAEALPLPNASGFLPLQDRARDILAHRRRRQEVFGTAMFGEPAWEILLHLYVLEFGARHTIGRLVKLAGASKSSGLRWIDYLEVQRLIRRRSHPTDRRAAFVELTEKGKEQIELYLFGTATSRY